MTVGVEPVEELEMALLLEALARRYGYDFRNYSKSSLKRRLRRAMQIERVATLSSLQERLLHHPAKLERFISTVAVHATSMFRDPPFYRALREHAVPRLRTYPVVRIWHAGCSTGEEVYSLAILLQEEGIYDRCRIYATDLSDELLGASRRGVFALSAMKQYTTNYIEAGGRAEFSSYYHADHDRVMMRDSLRKNVVFSHHNLVSDGRFNEFQMIICRNVMIYFDGVLRERVHKLLCESLCPFGMLGLGMREGLRGSPCEARYEPISDPVRLYRRID